MSYCSRKSPITIAEVNTMNLQQLNVVLDSCEANCGCYTGCDTVAYMNIQHKELEQEFEKKKNEVLMKFLCEQFKGHNFTSYDDFCYFDFYVENGGVLTLECDKGLVYLNVNNIEFEDKGGLTLEEYYKRSKKCST